MRSNRMSVRMSTFTLSVLSINHIVIGFLILVVVIVVVILPIFNDGIVRLVTEMLSYQKPVL